MQPVSDSKPSKFKFKFTLRHLFALVTVTAVVFSGIFYYISFREERERHRMCEVHLQQIGMALLSHESSTGRFPPQYVTDAQGKPLYSWRVLILPWLEERHLYDQWRMDEPWDSPHNRSLPVPTCFSCCCFSCPVADKKRQPGSPPYTDYLAVVGPGTAWRVGKGLKMRDIVDGTSNTVMVVEVRGSQIHWAEPVDLDVTGSLKINASPGLSIGSHHAGGAHVIFADGYVTLLPDNTSEEEIKALLTPAGGEDWNGRLNDYDFDIRWTGESWEGIHKCDDRELPFSIDFDVVDPTDEQKALAIVAAKKLVWRLHPINAPWEEKARLDAAKEVIEATHSQSDDTPADEDVQQLAGDMTLESWGLMYSVDDAVGSRYFVYTSPKFFPNGRIRVRFSTPAVHERKGEVMEIEAIEEVTVINE